MTGISNTSDKVLVHAFAVGHGDCTLIEYLQSDQIAFRVLCDAGSSLPEALVSHLEKNRRPGNAADIDVAILSHVDADHQGGFHDLFEDERFSIAEYWGPCLPAFRRHAWLFAPRVARAIERASALEKALSKRSIPVVYPLEGYSSTVAGGRVTLTVLSPPTRLLRRLLGADAADVAELLTSEPLPLEWLVASAAYEDNDDNEGALDATFSGRTFLQPLDFGREPSRTQGLGKEEVQNTAAERAGTGWEPDFFGNSVLNDTSLVVAVDIRLNGTQRRRILLTGDQENWAYIASKYPAGLGVDVLKAPHHGGQVYLADKSDSASYAVEQMYLWLRPRIVLVSAKGVHGLPHVHFRDSLRTVGSSLVCPNTRGFEPLTPRASKNNDKSCFVAYGCGQSAQRPHTVVTLQKDDESVDAPTCAQGTIHRGAAPIVVLSQRIVEPDEAFIRWTRTETEKHTDWIREKLNDRHNQFLETVEASSTPLLTSMRQVPVSWEDVKALAKSEGRHQLTTDPNGVLRFGLSRQRFWMDSLPDRYSSSRELYRSSTSQELSRLRDWLKSLPSILLFVKKFSLVEASVADRLRVLRATDLETLAAIAAAKLRIPVAFAEREILPVLMADMATTFSARWCDADSPREFPFRREACSAFVHLYLGKHGAPDVFSEKWNDVFWRRYEPTEDAFKFFLDQAKSSFFAPSVVSDLATSWPKRHADVLKPFGKKPYADEEFRRFEPGEFPAAFDAAQWTPLWTATKNVDDAESLEAL